MKLKFSKYTLSAAIVIVTLIIATMLQEEGMCGKNHTSPATADK